MENNDWISQISSLVQQAQQGSGTYQPPTSSDGEALRDIPGSDPLDFPKQPFLGHAPARAEAMALRSDLTAQVHAGKLSKDEAYKQAYVYAQKRGLNPEVFALRVLGYINMIHDRSGYSTPLM